MHTIKMVVLVAGAIVLAIGSTVVTIAALWGRPSNSSQKNNKISDKSIEDV